MYCLYEKGHLSKLFLDILMNTIGYEKNRLGIQNESPNKA